jgi:hypothetical protein
VLYLHLCSTRPVSHKERLSGKKIFVAMDHAVDLLFSHPETMTHGFFDETACTHTHTCNPLGPLAATHTHTCLHAHLQVFASGEDTAAEGDPRKAGRKPLGNREAVRKYREKKKAHAAFLEEEVKKLRATNQQLLRRLQGYAALEAEVARLRGLLFDVRGKIDSESEIDFCELQKRSVVGSVKRADPKLCFDVDGAELAAAPEESSVPTIVDLEVDGSDVGNSIDPVASLVK